MITEGEEALSNLRDSVSSKQPFNLILTDFQMPEMNDFNLAREIKTIESLKGVPIIVLSSAGRKGDGKIRWNGAFAYVFLGYLRIHHAMVNFFVAMFVAMFVAIDTKSNYYYCYVFQASTRCNRYMGGQGVIGENGICGNLYSISHGSFCSHEARMSQALLQNRCRMSF